MLSHFFIMNVQLSWLRLKTDGNASEHSSKIERGAFDALRIMCTTRRNLGGSSEIQRSRLNRTIYIYVFHHSR